MCMAIDIYFVHVQILRILSEVALRMVILIKQQNIASKKNKASETSLSRAS